MIIFVIVASIIAAGAIACLVVPLLRGDRGDGISREASNLSILLDQIRELNADLANGALSPEMHARARHELERRALEETQAVPARTGPARVAGAVTAAAIAGILPVAATLLYLATGNPEALSASSIRTASPAPAHVASPQMADETQAATLARRLEKDPNNAAEWITLARTYAAMNRLPEALRAFERAAYLAPDDPDVLVDYADVLALSGGRKPLELLQRALKADPTHWKALVLAGTAAFDRKDYRQAVAYWEKSRLSIPPQSGIARSIGASIDEARELGQLGAGAPSPTTSSGPLIGGTVTLIPSFAGMVDPNDTVFVFARAAHGPRTPLAIVRKRVKDLPSAFSLDDSMAMMPELKLSNFGEIVVGARVSKSGSAAPRSGDLEGFSSPVKIGDRHVALVIDSAHP